MKAASEGYSVSLEGKILGGRFRIDKRIGRGGMAWLFKSWDLQAEKYVAIKLLFPHLAEDEVIRARFIKESELQKQLQHPHIVQIMTLVEEGELMGSVMEWVDGEDLKQTISRHKGPMELEDLKSLCLPMLDALGYAHASGLVHRDIKPANILLYWDEGRPTPKLTDFGIAKALEETEGGAMTSTGSALGTMRYMSPEQIRDSKNVDHRADLYSFGVVMYQLATGEPPFRGSTENLMFKQLYEPPRPPTEICPSLPPAVEQVILRCLQKKPEDRFESCPVLKEALQKAIEEGISVFSDELEDELTIRPTAQPSRPTQALQPSPPRDPNASYEEDPSQPSGSLVSNGDASSDHSHSHSDHSHNSHARGYIARDDSSANSGSLRLPDDIHQDASSPDIDQDLAEPRPTLTDQAGHERPAPPPTIQSPQQGVMGPMTGQEPSGRPAPPPTIPLGMNTPFPPQPATGVATLATPATLSDQVALPQPTGSQTFDHLPATPFGESSPFGQSRPYAQTAQSPPLGFEDEDDYFTSEGSETVIARSPHSVAAQTNTSESLPQGPMTPLPVGLGDLFPPPEEESYPAETPPQVAPAIPTGQRPPHKDTEVVGMDFDEVMSSYPMAPTSEPAIASTASPGSVEDLPQGLGALPRWQLIAMGVVALLVFGALGYAIFDDPKGPPDGGVAIDASVRPNSPLPPLSGEDCTAGQSRPCYPGPKRTRGVGICKPGTQTCINKRWGACLGAVLPASRERCNGKDDNCDGRIDEGRQLNRGRSCTLRIGGCRYRGRMACNSRRRRMQCRINRSLPIPGIRRVNFRVTPGSRTFTLRYDGRVRSLRRNACIELRSAASRVSISSSGYALCIFPLPYKEKTWYIRMQRKSMMEPAANYCIRK